MTKVAVVVERDDTGRVFKIPVGPWPTLHTRPNAAPKVRNSEQLNTISCARARYSPGA
jgi:hypothetical protein